MHHFKIPLEVVIKNLIKLFQYDRCWKEWKNFCQWYSIEPLAGTSENLVAYLAFISKRHSNSVSTAYSHLSAVAYYYRINGRNSITENHIVSMYMKGLKRRNLSKPVKRAAPMTIDVLKDMRRLLEPENNPNLVVWRTVWRAHLEFGLMLRWDDVKRLTTDHISFEENAAGQFARVSLQGGKTIMCGNPGKNDRIIAPNGGEACLYALTKR